jgi:hypothetical protein
LNGNDREQLLNEAKEAIDSFYQPLLELVEKSKGRIEFQTKVPLESKYYFPHHLFEDFETKEDVFSYRTDETKIHCLSRYFISGKEENS